MKNEWNNHMNRYGKQDKSLPLLGAAYIRYSSEMQSDSFSLDAQSRQIKEQAERDRVTIVKVFSDPAQSACRKKFRLGINAARTPLDLRETWRRSCFTRRAVISPPGKSRRSKSSPNMSPFRSPGWPEQRRETPLLDRTFVQYRKR
jgi:hypothetical protein